MKRKILIVEDHPDSASLLDLTLSSLGNEVVVATSGEEAIDFAADFTPDAVLLDLSLPSMDGCETARLLRANPKTAKSLLIAVTGHGDASDIQKTMNAGFDHHLTKPADVAKIAELLGMRSPNEPFVD